MTTPTVIAATTNLKGSLLDDAAREIIRKGLLGKHEIYWRDYQPWLKTCGYQLRPRFQPDWVPSWQGSEYSLLNPPEDGLRLVRAAVIDATLIKDGKRVTLKRVNKEDHPNELEITQLWSSEALSNDPQNHCIPLLDVLYPPNHPDHLIMVLPFLRTYDTPRFDTFGEVIDCVDQLFKGLQFIHRQHVAHRDIHPGNIMMEGEVICPGSWHLHNNSLAPDGRTRAKNFTRTQRPPKYYFIDFGLSSQYDPSEADPLELPVIGGDKTVPEFQTSGTLFNPFHTDIYYMGNFVRENFIDGKASYTHGHYGMKFLQPLISDMVQDDPAKRPTIDEVVVRFEEMCKRLGSWKLRSRPAPRNAFVPYTISRVCRHWVRRVGYVIRRIPPIPSGWQKNKA
ncbi:hypothetical protein BDN72DRAFT_833699 [Pluteus cervinus]|uniref:Uncharacterized protein n=1 Tax=Pluteus cervinus TaxID=181527 RepID=A0ACD3B8H8_9AGAR|nr:hypothetical protein BDN72DRAFT_833699 [Pluteus cervinus]